nr:Calx-beta domain-containing protein [Leisingera sp. MMG026]
MGDDGVNLDRFIQVTATQTKEPFQDGRFAAFEVILSDPFSSTDKIRYTTKDNKAKAGQDHVETKGALTFAPSQTKAAVNAGLLPDYRAEGTEAFLLVLKQGSFPAGLNVTSGITAANARILDDDIRGTGRKDGIYGTGRPEGIHGPGGADWLEGGKGADVFVFYSGDSGTRPNKRDTVTDFNRKQGDKADLSEIDGDRDAPGVQDLMWIGRDAEFSGAGEVRFDTARSLLEINLDGDPAAEMRIDFDGLDVFGARDLIF